MDATTWAQVATDHNVSEDQWPMILDLAATRIALHPVLAGGRDRYRLAADLVSQRGDPRRAVSTKPLPERQTWPTRAENPAWWRSLGR